MREAPSQTLGLGPPRVTCVSGSGAARRQYPPLARRQPSPQRSHSNAALLPRATRRPPRRVAFFRGRYARPIAVALQRPVRPRLIAVALQRGADGSDPAAAQPVGGLAEVRHHHRLERSSLITSGTLACPLCDAPIALPGDPLSLGAPLECPYCAERGLVRDFLSLAEPSRPARVQVRVASRRRTPSRTP